MHIRVNDVKLFFDVEGARLRPDGPVMREVPTFILLHGGPGFDHSGFKPAFTEMAASAQVIYLDLRGNGRLRPPFPLPPFDLEAITFPAMRFRKGECRPERSEVYISAPYAQLPPASVQISAFLATFLSSPPPTRPPKYGVIASAEARQTMLIRINHHYKSFPHVD